MPQQDAGPPRTTNSRTGSTSFGPLEACETPTA